MIKHATQTYFPDIAPCGARRGGDTKFAWLMFDVTCPACLDAIGAAVATPQSKSEKTPRISGSEGIEKTTTKTETKTKRKPAPRRKTLAQRVAALEAALIETGAPSNDKIVSKPVIPLGYERCSLEQADRGMSGDALQMFQSAHDATWSDPRFKWPDGEAHKAGREIFLRCILPPAVAAHWKPASGRTHEEQRRHAWPMGRLDNKDWFAAWVPMRGSIVAHIEMITFALSDLYIPLVPKV